MKMTRLIWAAAAVVAAAAGLAADPYGDISDLKIAKPEDKVDVKPMPAPAGATVLFNGKDLDNWTKTDGKTPPDWEILPDGVTQVKPGTGNIITKDKFDGTFKLHVEFRVPYLPDKHGQERGNSGVYVQGRYEVQVLDSYGLDAKNDDCGAIYEVSAPSVNACKAPTVWQSYDIEFTAPKCEDGKKTAAPRITVYQNGVKIQDNVEITKDNTRAGLGGDVCTPGPLMLQDHGAPVQFRNVWLVQGK